MNFDFKYKLLGYGWAKVYLQFENKKIQIDASYFNNPPFELLNGINNIISKKANSSDVIFICEPGEYKLTLTKLNDREILLKLFLADEWISFNFIDENGNEVNKNINYVFITETIIYIASFAKLIFSNMQNILKSYGEKGYKEKWDERYSFPRKEYRKLKKYLKI
ncbi:MAG: hypothetical protein WC223_06310 [Bacteroidales bacterium]|jgi:hypothetical protein